jgi:hypothetical protein
MNTQTGFTSKRCQAKWLLALGYLLGCGLLQAATYPQWCEFRKNLLADPSVVRYYSFEGVETGAVANLANPQLGTLSVLSNSAFGHPRGDSWRKWQAEDYPQAVLGRWPQKPALRFSPAAQAVSRSRFYGTSTGSYTMAAWVCVNDAAPSQDGAFLNMSHGYKSGWRLMYNKHTKWHQDGKILLFAGIPTGSATLGVAMGKLPDDAVDLKKQFLWHQLVVTWNEQSKDLSLYLDGKLGETKNLPDGLRLPPPSRSYQHDPENDMSGLKIGGKPFTKSSTVDAKIDELVIYDRALPAAEILKQYQAGCPDGNAEQQEEYIAKSAQAEKALTGVRLEIPATSYGYFNRGEAIPVSAQVPQHEGWHHPVTVQFETVDAAGRPVPANSATSSLDQAGAWQSTFPAKFETCGLYWLRLIVSDSDQRVIKRHVIPIGIVAGLPDKSAAQAEISPLGALGLMSSQPECSALGIGFSRIVCHWGRIEQKKNELSWGQLDDEVEQNQRNGLKTVLCFTGLPSWMKKAPGSKNLPADLNKYRDVVALLVNRYQDDVQHWEIWDEPNSNSWNGLKGNLPERAGDYVQLLKNASEVIRRENPQAKVVGVCARSAALDWLKAVLAAKAAAHLDIVSLHSHAPVPNLYQSQTASIRKFRQVLNENGGEHLPLWNTSAGHLQPARLAEAPLSEEELMKVYAGRQSAAGGEPTIRGNVPMVSERRGAAWLVKDTLLQMADGVSRYFFNQGPSVYYPTYNHSDGDPSLKGIACAALVSQVVSPKQISRLAALPADVVGVGIKSGAASTAVLFATSAEAREFSLHVRAANTVFKGMDMFGNPLTWKSDDNANLSLTLTQEPVYIFECGI